MIQQEDGSRMLKVGGGMDAGGAAASQQERDQ
jgi:hypothetical protein